MIAKLRNIQDIGTWIRFIFVAACAAYVVCTMNLYTEQYTFSEMILYMLLYLMLFYSVLDTWWFEKMMPKDSDVYVTEKTLKTAIELGMQDSADGIVLHMDNTDWVLLRNMKNPNRNDNEPAKLAHFSVGG